MTKLGFLIFVATVMVISHLCVGQERSDVEETEVEGKHSLSFIIAHARIGQGRDMDGNRQFTTVPSISIDYNYWISPRFAIGVHTDLLNENFFIETADKGELIERERPIAPVVMGTYKPGKHWSFGLGFGGEFAEGEDYFVTRLGVEYMVEIRNGWGVLGALTQDFRAKAYNVTSIGLGIEKKF
ncbi:hypothetical protein [Algoriphagus sp. NG3]|uniref:hypothetical protein n=1 Tax=Algoriphagus sp. NG3 TaxID=3097546 RepID=UPI002A7EC8A5|nr:hypothetical protein [Algoriphagus sp. NG3]WPR75244.1 hypothetical protein SLW71_21515 [Algoriphagus sp. NG3]